MVQHFETFPLLRVDRLGHVAAVRLHRPCVQKGGAASTIECQIAVAAIRHSYALLPIDKALEWMTSHCKLVLT